MIMVIHSAALLVTLAMIWIIPAVLVARMAERRGRSFVVFLIIALVIPWPILLVVVLALPHRGKEQDPEGGDG